MLPESLSSHPEQLSSSEQEKLTVYRAQIPDFTEEQLAIIEGNRKRSNSQAGNDKLQNVERNLVLFNRPFIPKDVKHKRNKSENPSEVSEEMNEIKYYRNQQDGQEDMEDEYPEYDMDLDKNDTRGRKIEKEPIKAPVFVSSKSPSLKD